MYKTPRVFLFAETQTISTSKGTILPYCAESAVKLQSINPRGCVGEGSGAESTGHGGTSPHFYKWLGTGGTVSRRTANK